MREIAVYFDFISPYARFGWEALRRAGVPLRPVPVVFAALLDAHGQLGPAEVPSKRAFVIRDCLRRARELELPFDFPPRHPFRSIDALRLCLPEVAGERQAELIDALFVAVWQDRVDISDPEALRAIVNGLGCDADAMLARTQEPAIKARLMKTTEQAIARGVFGVPTFEVGDELVWGSDRVADALALSVGEGALDPARVAALEAAPTGVRRARVAGAPAVASGAVASGAVPSGAVASGAVASGAVASGAVASEVDQRIRDIFGQAGFMTKLGVELARVGAGEIETTLVVRDDHRQQDGFVHAAVVAAMADHSAGAAAGTLMPEGKTPLTIEYKINLLRPATGPTLHCIARVIKPGRTITVAEAEVENVTAGERKLVAKATMTLAVVDRAKPG